MNLLIYDNLSSGNKLTFLSGKLVEGDLSDKSQLDVVIVQRSNVLSDGGHCMMIWDTL